ncbi:MAG: aspartyl/asparaginyl beta-hydroxylase domain-containing protein [Acidobacteriota bacterium]|nr:aspartyl/asparaginyl beta-hydroxylase domain-containing protein [Acidobacteriota bacterium]
MNVLQIVRANVRKLSRQLVPYSLVGVLNPFYDLYTGGRRRPVLFDIDATCPALRTIDSEWPAIRAELESILPAKARMPRYHELDSDLVYASARYHRDKDWKVFMLECMGIPSERNRARCPRTATALDCVPGLIQAFFSILDPGKAIPAHCGPSRTYLRYQLALRVPRNKPPSIRIADHHHVWEEGKSILFDDSWNHEVYNESDEVRVVLIVDVLRPMPWLPTAVGRGVVAVAKQIYGKKVIREANRYAL